MKRLFVFSIIVSLASICSWAQNACLIQGEINSLILRSSKSIEKVYLNSMDEYERLTLIDSATVSKDGKFEMHRPIEANTLTKMHMLTGFDNGAIMLWVEPGTVRIHIKDAKYPTGAIVSGTPTNDLQKEYNAFKDQCIQVQNDTLKLMHATRGQAWIDSKEGIQRRTEVGNVAVMQQISDKISFLLAHTDSPLAPLFMEKELMHSLEESILVRILRSMSPSLYEHPYYKSFRNAVLARFLKVGSEAPDAELSLPDGKKTTLNDLRGKYVLLDFWASWCGPCRREIPNVIRLYEETLPQKEKFVIVSFSLDNKEKAWKDAIGQWAMDKEGWIHASDLMGWQSSVAKLFGVTAIPKTVLIDPEGKIVSLSLRGEEMVRHIKQLLAAKQLEQPKSAQEMMQDAIQGKRNVE